MNESWSLSVDNSNRTKTNWSVKNCSSVRASANRTQTDKVLQQDCEERGIQNDEENGGQRCWPRTQAIPRSCFSPRSSDVVMGAAVTRILRCVARDHDFSVRSGRLMTRHEQSLKAHEHTSNSSRLTSFSQNSWAIAVKPWAKFLVKTAHEDFQILTSPREDSWVPHEEKIPRDFFL